MALRTLFGLDVVDGRLEVDPHIAEGVPRVELRRLRFRGRTVDVTGWSEYTRQYPGVW
jgi:hypothetical protein